MWRIPLSVILLLSGLIIQAQPYPGETMGVSSLATYGNMTRVPCGDNDFVQIIFIRIPDKLNQPFYVRIYDPDCGGEHDIQNDLWETNTQFELYGGKACITHPDARSGNLEGRYNSGERMARALFARESRYDARWYTMGPFKAGQGEYLETFAGHFFKLLVEGKTGDDGNSYSLFVSLDPHKNVPVYGSDIFQLESTFQTAGEGQNEVFRLAPFIPGEADRFVVSSFRGESEQDYILHLDGHQAEPEHREHWQIYSVPLDPRQRSDSGKMDLVLSGMQPVRSSVMTVRIGVEPGVPVTPFYLPIQVRTKREISIDVEQIEDQR